MDINVEEIVKLAVVAGRMAAERTPADAFKATERRLYALPSLREKLERDREWLPKLDGAARTALEAAITADAAEVGNAGSGPCRLCRGPILSDCDRPVF